MQMKELLQFIPGSFTIFEYAITLIQLLFPVLSFIYKLYSTGSLAKWFEALSENVSISQMYPAVEKW